MLCFWKVKTKSIICLPKLDSAIKAYKERGQARSGSSCADAWSRGNDRYGTREYQQAEKNPVREGDGHLPCGYQIRLPPQELVSATQGGLFSFLCLSWKSRTSEDHYTQVQEASAEVQGGDGEDLNQGSNFSNAFKGKTGKSRQWW